MSQKTRWLSVITSATTRTTMAINRARIEDVAARQHDRLARHAPVELEEGDDRAGEGDGADGNAERHLDQRLAMDRADFADAEGIRRIDRGGRHHHRGKADERVEGGDELRHRRHGNALGDIGADAAADGKADDDQPEPLERLARPEPASWRWRWPCRSCRRNCPAAAGRRMRQAAQRQDEQDAGDQIQKSCEINAHRSNLTFLFSCTWRACGG